MFKLSLLFIQMFAISVFAIGNIVYEDREHRYEDGGWDVSNVPFDSLPKNMFIVCDFRADDNSAMDIHLLLADHDRFALIKNYGERNTVPHFNVAATSIPIFQQFELENNMGSTSCKSSELESLQFWANTDGVCATIQRNGKEYKGDLYVRFQSAPQITTRNGRIFKIADHKWQLYGYNLISFEGVDVFGKTEYKPRDIPLDMVVWHKSTSPQKEPSSWTPVSSDLTSKGLYVHCLAVSGSTIFAGTDTGGVYLSTNNGTSWTQVSSGLTGNGLKVQCLAVSGGNIFAGTYGGGVYLSTNNGTSWTPVSSDLRGNDLKVTSLLMSESTIFVGTNEYNGGGHVYLSTDSGTSWARVNLGYDKVYSLAVSGSTIVAGTNGEGVYLSTNSGTSWRPVNSGLPVSAWTVMSLAVSGSTIFAGTHGGVYLSTNNGTSWTQVSSGLVSDAKSVSSFAVIGNTIFAGTDEYNGEGVYLSTDSGTSWTPVNSGLTGHGLQVRSLVVSGSTIFAVTGKGVWSGSISQMVGVLKPESR